LEIELKGGASRPFCWRQLDFIWPLRFFPPMRELNVSSISLPPAPTGWFDYSYVVLADGNLAILRSQHDIRSEYVRWIAAKDFSAGSANIWRGKYMLSTFDGVHEQNAIEIAAIPYPVFTRSADGRWLIAAGRTDPDQPNGYLYDGNGSLHSRLFLGDGINFILAAPDTTIWVAYFDEGIYAGSIDDKSSPVSSGGLVRFSLSGDPLWSFNHENKAGCWIDDCYSLTLDGTDVWSCFYSDFPVVRIRKGEVRSWTNRVSGVSAIALEGDYAVLAGSYECDERLTLLRLDEATSKPIGWLDHARLEKTRASLVQGNGNALHVIADGVWERITVSDVRQVFASPRYPDRFKI
jgi:hypothetical protein